MATLRPSVGRLHDRIIAAGFEHIVVTNVVCGFDRPLFGRDDASMIVGAMRRWLLKRRLKHGVDYRYYNASVMEDGHRRRVYGFRDARVAFEFKLRWV